jgi:ribosomal protein S18 acetylase RimI-like enzyme
VKTRIRKLVSDDVGAYRELRLQALRESPTAFFSSFDEEAGFSMDKFAARLQPDGEAANGIFGAFSDVGQLIGMLGFGRESRVKRAHVGMLWGMYVLPQFRGQHVGASLLDEVLRHARQTGVRQVVLSVTADNSAACGLYHSRGFERFGLERDALHTDGRYFDEAQLALHFDLPPNTALEPTATAP